MDVRDLVKSGSKLQHDRSQPVSLAVVVELDANDALVQALRERLRPQTAGAALQVEVADPAKPLTLNPCDAVIAVAGGGGPALADAIASARVVRTPVIVVAVGDDQSRTGLADRLKQPLADLLVGDDVATLADIRLAAWLADEIGSKRLALAHNFAFMRRAVANEAVQATAMQNALVGAVAFVPGADMPIMTANQAKMLLQIAAAYGEKLGPERLRELAAIVGGAFVFRTVARQLLGFVPVLGWAVKGGIGYAGTVAMGKAAVEYFEDGSDFAEVARRLREGAGKAAHKLPLRGRRTPALPEVVSDSTQQELPGLMATTPEPGAAGE
jgi:uncharacterized protein (DUF697 family)